MPEHARPGKSFTEMLDLILRNQRRPNDPFSSQLLMAIFWEESFFTNKKQRVGSAIGFGQVEPAELPKLTTQRARDNGYFVPGVSAKTRSLSDDLAVTAPSCMLLHLFHTSKAPTTEQKVRWALEAYGGVHYQGKSSLTPADRRRHIANWRKCEEKLKALPFSEYAIANYSGNFDELADRYLDALALSRRFNREHVFSRTPLVRFRDLLFPADWTLYGITLPTRTTTTSTQQTAAPSRVSAAPAAGTSAARPEALFEEIVEHRGVRLDNGERFRLVAGPGESPSEVAAGDFLVRQPRDGARLRASRIMSGPATPDDFLCEGVMAECGPPGLYVVVVSRHRYPIARRISDRSGRVPGDTLVVRPVALSHAWDEDVENLDENLSEESDAELERKRNALVRAITRSDLYWHEVPLAGGYRIMVSSPVLKDNLFVPVTATETRELARKFEVFPLTRAVADQAYNVAVKVEKQKTPASLFDFITYSNRLKPTAYDTHFGYALTSGAHKLWVISSRGKAINYGFYIRRVRTDPVRCGKYLDPQYNVIQGLGARHNGGHWDYSQLLQFMTSLKNPDGQRVDLRTALLERNPAVWDEAQPPAQGSLP